MKVVDKHAPIRTSSKKEPKWNLKPWLSKGLQISIQKKATVYGKYVRTKNPFWEARYKLYSKLLKKLTFKAKQKYYEKYFTTNFHNANN